MSTGRGNGPVSRRAALAGIGVSGLGLAAAARVRPASAQDATDSTAHPVVGLWSNVTGPETPPGLRSFNAIQGDGSIAGLHSFGGTAIGAWRSTGERSVQFVLKYLNIAQAPGEFVDGTVTLTGSFTVDDAGTTLTEDSTVDIRDAAGAGVASFPFTTTFARVPFDALPAAGTPEA